MIPITDNEFTQLALFIKENYGIHLKKEKISLIISRLHSELEKNNCKSFTQYLNHIKLDRTGKSRGILIDKITTNHTFFMREVQHFDFLRNIALPQITSSIRDNDLRTWCAGCSSGEEAYTIAMLIDEFLGTKKSIWDAKILATDISSNVLVKAQEGIYTNEKINQLPTIWRANYFKKLDNQQYQIKDSIRKEIIFRRFNLMDRKFPFKKKFHIIFCRNVMIYFDNATKDELVQKFYNLLEYGGYLFIGQSEAITKDKGFKYVIPAIYRKE